MSTTQSTKSVPKGASNLLTNQAADGIQTNESFHSVSSINSSAEMSKYFPDAQTPSLLPVSHQHEVKGQAQSTASSNTAAKTNPHSVNAATHVPAPASTTVQQLPQPVIAPHMAQQRPVRPSGPSQLPSGIPSHSSQIEGLSVSQAVVNDVLVDLQTKVINETLQQYHEDASSGNYLEPLSPVYIQAPQPTIVLRSDLHRLRAELGNRVRPPVVYRHPAGANQFQQHQFQQNMFQAPTFPTPPQQHIPPESYGQYRNAAHANR
jgi:hypothetical protein